MEPLNKILGAAVELFSQYGFKTITMDDIARRAGISKKTLYQHFANKNEVVSEAVIWLKNNMTGSCEVLAKESANAVEALVRTQAMMDEMHKKMNPMALFEMQRYFPDTYTTFKDMLQKRDVEMIKDNLQQGIEEGLYRPEINTELMARYRLEMSLMIFQPNLLVTERHDLRFVLHEIFEHFLYGIMTPKGEKLYQKYKTNLLKQVSKV